MCVCRLLDSGKLKMIQCEILCAKNGTTAFAPVPDSINAPQSSNVEIYLSYFQKLYYYAFIGIVVFIFHFKSLSLKSFSI